MAPSQTGFFKGEGGVVWKFALPLTENLAEKLQKGYLTRVADADGNPYVPEPDPAAEPGPDPDAAGAGAEPAAAAAPDIRMGEVSTARPAARARKAEWVGHMVRVHGWNPNDADAKTVQDMVDACKCPAAS